MYCTRNTRGNYEYEFKNWIRKKNFKRIFKGPSGLRNPFLLLNDYRKKIELAKCWKPIITNHFRDDHCERLPSGCSPYQLIQAFEASLKNFETRPDRIEPYVYEHNVNYLVPLSFEYGSDYELYATCSVEFEGDVAQFTAITKLTKEMVRENNLLTLFEEYHSDWMNPSNDNVDLAKQMSKVKSFDKQSFNKKMSSDNYMNLVKTILRNVSFDNLEIKIPERLYKRIFKRVWNFASIFSKCIKKVAKKKKNG